MDHIYIHIMNGFYFDGRSRPNRMHLVRDQRPTRDSLLDEVNKRRQKREEEQRRQRAAERCQRAVRSWQARQFTLRRAMCVVEELPTALYSSDAVASPARQLALLEHAAYCYRYVRRHQSLLPTAPSQGDSTGSSASPCPPHERATVEGREEYQKAVVQNLSRQFFATLLSVLRTDAGMQLISTEASVRVLICVCEAIFSESTLAEANEESSAEETAAKRTQRDQASLQTVMDLATAMARRSAETDSHTGGTSASVQVSQAGTESFACALLHLTCEELGPRSLSFRGRLEPALRLLLRSSDVFRRYSAALGAAVSGTPAGGGGGVAGADTRSSSSEWTWETVCWECLTASSTAPYLSLTSNALLTLLSVDETCHGAAAETAEAGPALVKEEGWLVAALVQVAYDRVVRSGYFADSSRVAAASPAATAGGNSNGAGRSAPPSRAVAVFVLDRLTRLLPFFLHYPTTTTKETSATSLPPAYAVLRKKWLLCVAVLIEKLCRNESFVRGILYDLQHNRADKATTASSPQVPPPTATASSSVSASASSKTTRNRRSAGGYGALSSHLFSSEGGLRLLEQLASSEEVTNLAASSDSISAQEDALLAASALETLCGVYAWPLRSFAFASSQEYRLETSAILAKLTRTPQLLKQLWRLYREHCPGIKAVEPFEDEVPKLCRRPAPQLPKALEVPSSVLASLRIGVSEAPAKVFWDPNPALSTLFFTLLNYYVDVTDFADDLQRGSVLSQPECWALILALKDAVYRSHFIGVLPHANSEVVAHLAYVLLGKLRAVDEVAHFVPFPSLWIATTDQAVMHTLSEFNSREWDELAEEEAETAARAAEVDDGDDDSSSSSSSDSDTEHRVTTTTAAGPPSAIAARGPMMASAVTASSHVQRRRRLPGEDRVFHRCRQWSSHERAGKLLMRAPYTIPFAERAALLTSFLLNEEPVRAPGGRADILVRRGRVFADGYTKFHADPISTDLFFVRFASAEGVPEDGYGRGVYREFVVSLCKEGFSAEHGLFRLTDTGFLYPNAFSLEATGDSDHLQKFTFLGTMVGRAVRDGILQDVPFAQHFLNSILGRRNALNHLKNFDPQLYHQLLSLTKMSEADLESTGLTFTYTSNELGVTREVELTKGGAETEVTTRNCLYYVHLVANFKLNGEAASQTNAFRVGLERVLRRSWLQLFDSNELLSLFGGDRSGRIDLADWRRHTVYQDPEDETSVPVRLFWEVVESLTTEQQCKLLQFTTSMRRPPLLGFRFLSPPFKVYLVRSLTPDRLPTAATCFSTIKIPPYDDYAVARAKIVAAIEGANTFTFT